MTDHETRLREALQHVAVTTHAESRLDLFRTGGRRRMPAPLKALAAFVLVLGLAVPLALSFEDSSEGVGTQPTAPVSSSADVETPPAVPVAELPAALMIDDLSAAVAPFDHESFVDSLLFQMSLIGLRNQQVFDCIAAAGFVPPSPSPLPDRSDPTLYSADFPDYEALARDGFPDPSAPESPPGATATTAPPGAGSAPPAEPSGAYAAVSRECADQVDSSGGDVVVAYGLYASMRSAWEGVLAEIEDTEEVRSLVNGFGSCLREQGVPAEFTNSEGAFLGYADSLLMATGGDQSTWPAIRESTGKLYAECGRDLFAAREALRSGARREAFLGEHQESISQLWNLLLIIDSSPPIDTAVTTIATTTSSLGDEALLACMVGTWSVDSEGFAAAVQANIDPRGDIYVVTVESGDGSLTITADKTFTVSYDGLTIRIHEPGHSDTVIVVSGEVAAGFTLQGNVFLAGEIDGDPLVVLRSLSDGTWAEVPPAIRDISLRLGTPANRPLYMETVTIDCSGDRLVVNDEVRIDTSTGDGPSTVWVRDQI
jgi:hypothetical protein